MKTSILWCVIGLLFATSSVVGQQTLVLQPDADSGKDAWIWSWPNAIDVNFGELNVQNGGLHNVLRAEHWQWTFAQYDTIRSLLSFDLSVLPAEAIVDSAKLDLYFFRNPSFTPQTGLNSARIHPITQNWNESSVTWLNQPDYDNTIFAHLPSSNTANQDYIGIDVTNLVWNQMQNQNFGWLLKLQNETGLNGLTFASSDNENDLLRPRLTVYYQLNTDILKRSSPNSEFKLFPNPGTGVFYLSARNIILQSIQLELHNSHGQSQSFEYENHSETLKLNLSHLPSGIYWLRVKFDSENEVLKLIKR